VSSCPSFFSLTCNQSPVAPFSETDHMENADFDRPNWRSFLPQPPSPLHLKFQIWLLKVSLILYVCYPYFQMELRVTRPSSLLGVNRLCSRPALNRSPFFVCGRAYFLMANGTAIPSMPSRPLPLPLYTKRDSSRVRPPSFFSLRL